MFALPGLRSLADGTVTYLEPEQQMVAREPTVDAQYVDGGLLRNRLDHVRDPPGDRLDCRPSNVTRARAGRQTGDHAARGWPPPRRTESGQRRQDAHARGIVYLTGEAGQGGGIGRQTEVAAQPLEQRSGGEHA